MKKRLEIPAEKPRLRERLCENGAANLADHELLALLLRTGSRTLPVEQLAQNALVCLDNYDPERALEGLRRIDGMGTTKACTVLAAFELGRRRFGRLSIQIRSARDLIPLVQQYADRKQEHFLAVSLNGAHETLAVRVVTIGLLNRTMVHPREVYADPICDRAASLIVCHNHPSGQLTPSEEDIAITKRIAGAGEILGIPLLDHIIFHSRGYFSFMEGGIPFR